MKPAVSAVFALLLLLGSSVRAESEYDVKAAYLYKFTKFVEWPRTAFASAEAPFVIGVIGRDPFGELDRLIQGNTTGARRIEVRHFTANDSEAFRECQMIFVSASEQHRLGAIVAAVQGRPVLLVGESEGFASAGGMLGFALRENRVGIEVNSAAARQARLKISSQLLNIAKIVD